MTSLTSLNVYGEDFRTFKKAVVDTRGERTIDAVATPDGEGSIQRTFSERSIQRTPAHHPTRQRRRHHDCRGAVQPACRKVSPAEESRSVFPRVAACRRRA